MRPTHVPSWWIVALALGLLCGCAFASSPSSPVTGTPIDCTLLDPTLIASFAAQNPPLTDALETMSTHFSVPTDAIRSRALYPTSMDQGYIWEVGGLRYEVSYLSRELEYVRLTALDSFGVETVRALVDCLGEPMYYGEFSVHNYEIVRVPFVYPSKHVVVVAYRDPGHDIGHPDTRFVIDRIVAYPPGKRTWTVADRAASGAAASGESLRPWPPPESLMRP